MEQGDRYVHMANNMFALVLPYKVPVKMSLISPCAMSLELPLLVRSGVFLVFLCLSEGLSGSPFSVFFDLFLE